MFRPPLAARTIRRRAAGTTRRRAARRCGFTLVEALAALTVVGICALPLLMGLSASIDTTTLSSEQTIAQGIAQQLLDEIAGQRYAGNEGGTTLGPTAWEQGGTARERFDDLDDYHGYSATPPCDAFGQPLGADDGVGGRRPTAMQLPDRFLNRWRQQVSVQYVTEANPLVVSVGGVATGLKAVTVTISYDDPTVGWRELARARRVFAAVPPPATAGS